MYANLTTSLRVIPYIFSIFILVGINGHMIILKNLFSQEHLAIAMSNLDNIIQISPVARRNAKDKIQGESDQSLPISTGEKLNDEDKGSGKEVKLLALCPGEKINNEDKVWEKQKIPNNFR